MTPGPERRARVTVRALEPADHPSVRALAAEIAGTPYDEIVLPPLETALGGGSDEARGLVALTVDAVVGVAVFGLVAGTTGTARLHLVAVSATTRLQGVAWALVDAAARELARTGSRLMMAELPDDPALHAARQFLRRAEFEEEARVPDFYRDGVALVVLRRRLREF